MAEARDFAVNREFIVSGFLSGQAYRLAVNVDTAATRLVRFGLREFDKARALEKDLVDALTDLERTAKDVRKKIDKVNRRRREGVPTSGPKQTFMVRSLPSAHAFRCAVAIDQIQRDISMLGLAASGDVAKTASSAQGTVSDAISIADSVVQSVLQKVDRSRRNTTNGRKSTQEQNPKTSTKRALERKPQEKTQAAPAAGKALPKKDKADATNPGTSNTQTDTQGKPSPGQQKRQDTPKKVSNA